MGSGAAECEGRRESEAKLGRVVAERHATVKSPASDSARSPSRAGQLGADVARPSPLPYNGCPIHRACTTRTFLRLCRRSF